ncbi:MAG: hypothetical protein KC900_10605 [Candidatus Omnitrophica bacterium]|nr:hypothetical protein [Candidatus Omnitrophota bacterium]
MTSTLEQRETGTRVNQTLLLRAGAVIALLAIVVGIGLRFFRITENTFVFYDEGMWLLQGRDLVEAMETAGEAGKPSSGRLIEAAFHLSLRTGKALWAFMSMLRGFFVGADGFFFTRIISAVAGTVTIGLTFLFARRFYASTTVGLLAAAVLAVMPTHIFYSRLALQEAFSACFFLLGMYLYVFGKRVSVGTFLSGLCFASVFFVNYRMIIIPFFVAAAEVYLNLTQGRRPSVIKWACSTAVFLGLVFGIGALDGAANLRVTFGWMFHQGELAKGTFAPLNLLSYPYYMLTFEGVLFSLLFWANGYLLWKGERRAIFPWVMVLVFMAVFSLPQEKGVRYLTSALPFIAVAVAWSGWRMFSGFPSRGVRWGIIAAVSVMAAGMIGSGIRVAGFNNDYRAAISDIRREQPDAKFVSTQSMIQKLYVADPRDVMEFRYHMNYLAFLNGQGYRYLVIDPQAYVSFTENDLRFEQKLKGFLDFIEKNVEPEREYRHFSRPLLKRFVLEHNEHLGRSLAFVRDSEEQGFGKLRVYDLNKVLFIMKMAVAQWQKT